jgi:hypothetical protein
MPRGGFSLGVSPIIRDAIDERARTLLHLDEPIGLE